MSAIRKIVLIIFTFFYIFNPTNFANFNLYYVLILTSIGYSIVYFREFFKILLTKSTVFFVAFNLYLCFYIIFISEINDGNAQYKSYAILLTLFLLPCAFYVIREFSILYEYDFDNLISFLTKVITIQLLVVVASLLIPELRTVILVTSRDPGLLAISDGNGLRSFGLANGYTSTFPMFLGIFALFHMYYFSIAKKFLPTLMHMVTVVLLILAVGLNARTGLIPIVLFSIFVLFRTLTINQSGKILFLFVLGLLVFVVDVSTDLSIYTERLSWAIQEISDLSNGVKTGTFSVLREMLILPSTLPDFLFGQGVDVFGENSPYSWSSDIGLVKDLFIFGFINLLIYSFVIYYFFMNFVKEMRKKFGLFFSISLLMSLFAFYIKGATISGSEIFNFMLLLQFFYNFINVYKYNIGLRYKNVMPSTTKHPT